MPDVRKVERALAEWFGARTSVDNCHGFYTLEVGRTEETEDGGTVFLRDDSVSLEDLARSIVDGEFT